MNRTDEGPVLQLLSCLTEILQGLTVQKLHFAHCAHRRHEPGNVVDNLAPRQFPRMQGLLYSLAILDVYAGSVPFEDVAPFILQWIAANQEPSIGTVETANPRLGVDRGPGSQTRLPLFDQLLMVLGMNRLRPPPALRLFRSHARVIEPYLIEEVAVAARTSSPSRRGDRVDDGGEIALARPQSLLRTGVGDSDRGLIRKQT